MIHVETLRVHEFRGIRDLTLAEKVGHLSRLLGLPQSRTQAAAQQSLRVKRHLSLERRLRQPRRATLHYRRPRVRWEKWPQLYRRVAA